MTKNTTITKRIKELKETAQKEIDTCRVMIGFYEKEASKHENPKEKSEILLKVQKIKGSLIFNDAFLEYLNTL